MRARNILFLFVALMALGIMACNSGGGSGGSTMDRPIDASSVEAYQEYMVQLGQDLSDEEKAKVAKAIMIVSMEGAMKSMSDPSAMQGMSQGEVRAQAEAAQTTMLAYIDGKTPNELIKMAEETEARLKNK